MQSFAKAAAKPKKADTPQPAEPSAAEEDSSMPAMSDDGEDDSVAMPEPKGESEEARKSRKQRQDDLKRMMEESSEDEEPEKEDTPMEEPEEEAPAPEPEKKEDAGPAEVIASTGDGRRRGKRRVMTKKTVMDDQGYLGKSHLLCLMFNLSLIPVQSPSKNLAGSPSRKMSRWPLPRRRPRPRHNLRSPRRRVQRDRATSCLSSARSSREVGVTSGPGYHVIGMDKPDGRLHTLGSDDQRVRGYKAASCGPPGEQYTQNHSDKIVLK